MDLQKAKIFLEKINREFTVMQRDPEQISAIDVDILRQYTRDFYDSILSEKTTVVINSPQAPAKDQPTTKHGSRSIGFNPERSQPKTPAPPQEIFIEDKLRPIVNTPAVEEVSRPAQTPFFDVKPEPVKPSPPPKEVPIVDPVPTIASIQEPPPPVKTTQPSTTHSPETLALFEFKEPKELSEKLSETPIADLKKAFSLNDRLLMTRELFGGDSKALENTVSTIQSLTSFEEAKSFLIQFCADQYNWADKTRIEHSRHFIKIVRRRFTK